jgi:hypothetical protein
MPPPAWPRVTSASPLFESRPPDVTLAATKGWSTQRSGDGTAKHTGLMRRCLVRSIPAAIGVAVVRLSARSSVGLASSVPAGQPVINRPAGAISATVRWSDPLLIPRLSAAIHRVKTNTHGSHHGLNQWFPSVIPPSLSGPQIRPNRPNPARAPADGIARPRESLESGLAAGPGLVLLAGQILLTAQGCGPGRPPSELSAPVDETPVAVAPVSSAVGSSA